MRYRSAIICILIFVAISISGYLQRTYAGGSCPFIYTWDGEQWVKIREVGITAPNAKDFSPTEAPLSDRTKKIQLQTSTELVYYKEDDYIKLTDNQQPFHGSYRIIFEQQPYAEGWNGGVLLEHYKADLIELAVIDHPKNTFVFVERNGKHFVSDPAYWHHPVSAVGSDGRDYMKQIATRDLTSGWRRPANVFMDNDEMKVKDYLDRLWDGIEGATSYKREEYINNEQVYKKAVDQIETSGNYVTLNFGNLSSIPKGRELRLLLTTLNAGGVTVNSFYTKDSSGRWVRRLRDRIAETIWYGINIDDWIIDRSDVQIRIMTKGDIDWAVIDASPAIEHRRIDLSSRNAVTENGANITADIAKKDGRVFEFWAGQKAYLDFDYDPLQDNHSRSFVLKIVGQNDLYKDGSFDKKFVEYLDSIKKN